MTSKYNQLEIYHLSSVLLAFLDDDGSVVGRECGGRLTTQCGGGPRARSSDHSQRQSVDEDEQKEEERAPELTAAVDLVEPVGADETRDDAEVAVDGERIGA